jgi:hypothetical protein
MTGAPRVVLDACVLANFSLCDTLLRLAESPSLFDPKWSEEIMAETIRTLELKLGWPGSLTAHFQSELRMNFPEAWIDGFQALVPRMENKDEDRHVLAAAAQCGASIILTFNLRHFRPEHGAPWGIRALHPQTFLLELLQDDPAGVTTKLRRQAEDRRRTLRDLLWILRKTVPDFADAAILEFREAAF